ncbi:MAG: hypothetical protein O3A51_02580, partial [Verrucomicrobia bacterium]|nr:hypothetical protein [Verrucomicrobiota bacterium]
MTTRKARTPSVKSLARSVHCDGPASQNFAPVRLRGGRPLRSLAGSGVSDWMAECASHALLGAGVAWGIPFHVGRVFVVHGEPQTIPVNGLKAPWIIVRHTSDLQDQPRNADGFYPATTGPGRLNEHAADYVFVYADGSEVRWPIRCRYEVGDFQRIWGENNLASVAAHKPMPITPVQERRRPHLGAWGRSQQRVHSGDDSSHWVDWLCAWENPHPRKIITAIRLEPRKGALVLSAITGGKASAHPLRWARRQKALLRMPRGVAFDPTLDAEGCLSRLQIDMGQVISAVRQPDYPDAAWSSTPNNSLPEAGDGKLLIEYTAHPDAHFHLEGGRSIPVSSLKADRPRGRL